MPFFRLPPAVLTEIARGLAKSDYGLVIVAEGYESERRKNQSDRPSASVFFRQQLADAGLVDSPEKRIIAEPFSRYIRGVRPAFLDVSAAYLKASLLFDAFEQGRTEIMPFVLAAHDVGVRAFADIHREDGIEPAFLPLLDRLGLPGFRAWIRENFISGAPSPSTFPAP